MPHDNYLRDNAILLDIARAARLILEFKQEMDKRTFVADLKTQSAVLHQLMVMGEAVKRLSAEFRALHPAIPWSLMAGMRDKLIHGYDLVELDRVWKTVEVDVPAVLAAIEPLLPKQE
jgi:uncharacterized protein with HEPN domain